jgi:hypothetical protein
MRSFDLSSCAGRVFLRQYGKRAIRRRKESSVKTVER